MAYTTVLVIHSILRWVVLLAGTAAVAQAIVALASGGAFEKRHKLTNLAYLISLDTQLLIGLILYLGLSPFGVGLFSGGMGAVMKDSVLRFWAVEHVTGMVVGIVLMYVAYVFVKRGKTDKAKHVWTAVGMGLSLLIVLASIPWPFRAAGRALFPGLGF